jgi:N-methylhydantoinase B
MSVEQQGDQPATPVDPTRLEVFRYYLTGAAEEVWMTVRRSAYSLTIKERGDCSGAIFDAAGDMLAIPANGVPLHQGSLEALVHEVLARFSRESLRPGDMFITNDPYAGGTHTPDYCLVAPVFAGGEIVAFVANVGHHSDVGGPVACSIAASNRSIYEEGLVLPPVRLVAAGRLVEDVLRIVCRNSRMPLDREGDLHAQIGASEVGTRRIQDLVAEWGVDQFKLYSRALLDYSGRRIEALLGELPDGRWGSADALDGDGSGSGPVTMRLVMAKRGDRLTLDWTGMPDQTMGSRNVPVTTLRATCFCVVRGLLDPNLLLNSGFYKAVRLLTREGSMVHPLHPAAVGDRATSCQVLADMVAACIAQMVPDRGLAAAGCFQAWAFEGFDPRHGRSFAVYESIAGGLGATSWADGIDAVRGWPLGSMNAPVEAFERDVPVIFREYSLRPDSGGAGRYQGGLGMRRVIEVLGRDMLMTTYAMRQVVSPPGLGGADAGAPGSFVVNPDTPAETRLPPVVTNHPVNPGDTVLCLTPGGGGSGPPAGRDPRLIERDLRLGRMSEEFAREGYGYDPSRWPVLTD